MKDIQNIKGDYGYNIEKVGVKNVLQPINIKRVDGSFCNTIGNFNMYVSLNKNLRGINMSRFLVLLSEYSGEKLDVYSLKNILEDIKRVMQSEDSYIDIKAQFFKEVTSPISNLPGFMNYQVKFIASLINAEYKNIVEVEVPINTLCPCSKEISDYSAHNQRCFVTVKFEAKEKIWIEEIIDMIEKTASCKLYPVLKRIDEKYVTENAYNNPKFVEDIVRDGAKILNEDERILYFKISSKSEESIHRHDAFAVIEIDKR